MDIKRLSMAARLPKYMHDTEAGLDALSRFAELVAAKEREACAKVERAARAVLRDALDDVEVHPCDDNDEVRGSRLCSPMRELYVALRSNNEVRGCPHNEQETER